MIEDQSENPGNISEEEFNRHGDARRAETRKLLADGKIVSGEDFSDASLIFTHEQTPDDFLFAHILAVEALIRGGSADKWIAAATLDHYLQSVNQPQVFGTQYSGVKSAANTPKAFRSNSNQPMILNRNAQVVMVKDHFSRLLDRLAVSAKVVTSGLDAERGQPLSALKKGTPQ